MTTNKMQLFWLIYLFLINSNILGEVFAHHQEHLIVLELLDIIHQYCCRLLSWMRWNCSSNSFMTPSGSSIGGVMDEMELQFQLIHGTSQQQ